LQRMEAGEMRPLSFKECKEAKDFLIAQLGKQRLVSDCGPNDFEQLRTAMPKTRDVV
jgi:hypothetical protein